MRERSEVEIKIAVVTDRARAMLAQKEVKVEVVIEVANSHT